MCAIFKRTQMKVISKNFLARKSATRYFPIESGNSCLLQLSSCWIFICVQTNFIMRRIVKWALIWSRVYYIKQWNTLPYRICSLTPWAWGCLLPAPAPEIISKTLNFVDCKWLSSGLQTVTWALLLLKVWQRGLFRQSFGVELVPPFYRQWSFYHRSLLLHNRMILYLAWMHCQIDLKPIQMLRQGCSFEEEELTCRLTYCVDNDTWE